MDQAERDLTEYCTNHAGDWVALEYYISKRASLAKHCDLEHEKGEHDVDACNSLGQLEKFTREQMCTGSIKQFVNNLLIMHRSEERRAQQLAEGPGGAAAAAPAAFPLSSEQIKERVMYIRLFHGWDTNGDGTVDLLEFKDGLEALGAVLTDEDMRQIMESVVEAPPGEPGEPAAAARMTLDEFVEVMESVPLLRGLALGAGDGNFLRHATHVHSAVPHVGGGAHLLGGAGAASALRSLDSGMRL